MSVELNLKIAMIKLKNLHLNIVFYIFTTRCNDHKWNLQGDESLAPEKLCMVLYCLVQVDLINDETSCNCCISQDYTSNT